MRREGIQSAISEHATPGAVEPSPICSPSVVLQEELLPQKNHRRNRDPQGAEGTPPPVFTPMLQKEEESDMGESVKSTAFRSLEERFAHDHPCSRLQSQ